MRIVADEDILLLDSAFGKFGELIKRPGREISPSDLRDADALLIRSITRVDAELLVDSKLGFIASATSGLDHIDQDCLHERNITLVDAKGCNASAVQEYCLTALAYLGREGCFDLKRSVIAVIGAGSVGGGLAGKLAALGIECIACDPLLSEEQQSSLWTQGVTLVSLGDALQANIISLHTPLAFHGKYATHHLLNAERLSRLAAGTVLINTSRGPVIDNTALLRCLEESNKLTAVLDVWEGEPRPTRELLNAVRLATPHLAGYSLDAKIRATEQIREKFCRHFEIDFNCTETIRLQSHDRPEISAEGCDDILCANLLTCMLDLQGITEKFRQLPVQQMAAGFDQLRNSFSGRREWPAWIVHAKNLNNSARQRLATLGLTTD
jgi:erythronate-4-phosphate dehydrogenase